MRYTEEQYIKSASIQARIIDELNIELKALKKVTEQQKNEFAIGFANWLDELNTSQKVSLWSKNGEHSGLFPMDNEQLLNKYKRILRNKLIAISIGDEMDTPM